MYGVSENYKILLVDDEPQILRVLLAVLNSDGYEVECAGTGCDTFELFEQMRPDAVILDLGLPDMDGQDIIRTLRETSETPILVLSARQEPDDKINAIDAGANDYISKPFHMGELTARLRNALRQHRRLRENAKIFVSGDLQIDFDSRRVHFKGKQVRFTRKEYEILRTLAEHADQIVTHGQLLQAGWNGAMQDSQYVRIYVGRIRQKLAGDAFAPPLIETEAGIGYRLIHDA